MSAGDPTEPINPTGERSLRDVLATLPAERDECLELEIRELQRQSDRIIIVLDDDPTGTQTVHDVPVLTTWSVDAISEEVRRGSRLVFILTNSRSLPENAAVELAGVIGRNLASVVKTLGCQFTVISRSDSTLRGHYPAEVDALADAIGQTNSPQIILPFFMQGGRFTIDDVHYVAEADRLIPAGETAFAQDRAFRFCSSNLIDWVMEKRSGDRLQEQVVSISLEELRSGKSVDLANRLTGLNDGQICVVNAVTMQDVRSFCVAALRAEASGRHLVYRTAASFVQAYAGIETRVLLDRVDMINPAAETGLIVIGSYVPKTTAQFRRLTSAAENLIAVELDVECVLGPDAAHHVREVVSQVQFHLQSGHNVVLHTSRNLIAVADAVESLRVGSQVSDALVEIVCAIDQPLRFLIAKGGITSSDIATRGLNCQRAIVLGQILPGVPVWRTQSESCRPGLAYVIFPGNVGDDDALLHAYEKLK